MLSKAALGAVARKKPDILCLQEVRAREEQVGQVLAGLPHHAKASPEAAGLGVKLTYKEDAEVDQNQLIIRFYKAMGYRWTPSATVTTIGLADNIA